MAARKMPETAGAASGIVRANLRAMNADALIARLAPFPATLDTLLAGLPDADWRWRPAEGKWSIVEIVNHLVDEESEDFRARVVFVLGDAEGPWPRFDPPGAVTARRYQERDPKESLARFRAERAATLAYLRGLVRPEWDRAKVHPSGRPLHAGELLASWPAHDARHLEQIAKRLHGLAARDAAPWSVEYAG